ncbi:MAG: YicC family protein [Gemmatimonadota bacterium]|nr:YicC family protein [Gemmatimonadota bacterium]
MTGFGAATGRVGTGQVTVELRTVNHRFFNPHLKLPTALSRWEGEIREALRREIARGHVTMSVRIERAAENPVTVDESRFARYVDQLRELQQRHALDASLDVGTILRLPDVISGAAADEIGGTVEEMVLVVRDALAALTAMREAEGGRLAGFLIERVGAIEGAVAQIATRTPDRLVAERDRLRKSVRELAEGVDVDAGRLAQEVALLADRLDVCEELERFRSHIAAFRATLEKRNTDAVGKRLGFLLQEMLREANTTGSKARDAAIQQQVVIVKEELERMAEQVENLE